MTPYQRGQRDALKALTTELERLASAEAKIGDGTHHKIGSAHATAALASRCRANALRHAADLARTRSEALPHDPEEDPPCPA